MSWTPVAAIGAFVVGCFSPNVPGPSADANGDNDTTHGGSATADATGTSATGSTTSLSESSSGAIATDQSSDAGSGEEPVDGPPLAENLRINGSAEAAELGVSSEVLLEVDVSDDIGIDRVEYYAGVELIGIASEEPYEALVLFTSADNGYYWITATAYDTSGQSVQAGPVTLDVTIEGGVPLLVREEVFVSRTFGDATGGAHGWWVGAPSLSIVDGTDIVVAGSSRYQGPGFTKSRWTVVRHDGDLFEAWQRVYPAFMDGSSLDRQTTSSAVQRGQQVLLMEAATDYSTYPSNTVYPINAANGSLGSHTDLATGDPFQLPPARSLAVDGGNNLLALTTEGLLFKLDPAGRTMWQVDAISGLPGGQVTRVTAGAADAIYVDVLGDTTYLRKFSSAGEIEWTRENGGVSQPLSDGTVVSVGSWFGDDAATLLLRDGEGVELNASELAVDSLVALDMCATPAGDVVIVGARSYGAYPEGPAIARATTNGEVIWATALDVGSTEFAIASGVATTPAGRLYVSGVADVTYPGLGAGVGDVWVAELML
jgi:hypothetical protein